MIILIIDNYKIEWYYYIVCTVDYFKWIPFFGTNSWNEMKVQREIIIFVLLINKMSFVCPLYFIVVRAIKSPLLLFFITGIAQGKITLDGFLGEYDQIIQ